MSEWVREWRERERKNRGYIKSQARVRNFIRNNIYIDKCDPFYSVHFNSVLTIRRFVICFLYAAYFRLRCSLAATFPSLRLFFSLSLSLALNCSFLLLASTTLARKSNCIKMWFSDLTTIPSIRCKNHRSFIEIGMERSTEKRAEKKRETRPSLYYYHLFQTVIYMHICDFSQTDNLRQNRRALRDWNGICASIWKCVFNFRN